MGPDDLVFFLRVEVEGEEPQLRGLFTGLWYSTCEDYTYRGCGPWVVMEPYHIPWAKPVEAIEMEVRYPVVALRYRDALLEEAGLEVEAELISPLLPGDLRTSSTPAVLMRFHMVNRGSSTVRASIMAVARNPARSAGAAQRGPTW